MGQQVSRRGVAAIAESLHLISKIETERLRLAWSSELSKSTSPVLLLL